ncbi:MAG: hypothetical protein J0I42_06060 [Bosea sp.]|uniref:hypothetical protein n=1 Tax=Bosea sp. (in: a-proteobacteria) TaxID=1871050 RepID=UPI001AD1E4A9|nr:hypothetical protein [Bosea sp. (in: a-proteobacteria)]MBN9451499.1 hypothetical protein [Bosea sp. (in: a-proteobacteria)]
MTIKSIDPVADLPYAKEFMEMPVGRHSPNLQRILRFMRSEAATEKPCLLILEPGRKWALVRLGGPGEEHVVSMNRIYTDEFEAERDVFARRWLKLTGQDLHEALSK